MWTSLHRASQLIMYRSSEDKRKYINSLPVFREEEYISEEMIGEGGHGKVYKATPNASSSEVNSVALKVARGNLEHLFLEIYYMQLFASAGYAPVLYDIFRAKDITYHSTATIIISMEHMEGTLTDYYINQEVSISHVEAFLDDAISFMKKEGILCVDVKPANILYKMVNDTPKFALIDFGSHFCCSLREHPNACVFLGVDHDILEIYEWVTKFIVSALMMIEIPNYRPVLFQTYLSTSFLARLVDYLRSHRFVLPWVQYLYFIALKFKLVNKIKDVPLSVEEHTHFVDNLVPRVYERFKSTMRKTRKRRRLSF